MPGTDPAPRRDDTIRNVDRIDCRRLGAAGRQSVGQRPHLSEVRKPDALAYRGAVSASNDEKTLALEGIGSASLAGRKARHRRLDRDRVSQTPVALQAARARSIF